MTFDQMTFDQMTFDQMTFDQMAFVSVFGHMILEIYLKKWCMSSHFYSKSLLPIAKKSKYAPCQSGNFYPI
jgi:hypothetical protein